MHVRNTLRRLCIASSAALLAAVGTLSPVASATASAAESSMASKYIDGLGRPTDHTVGIVNDFADEPWVPKDVENMLRAAVAFYSGQGDQTGGPELPENAPNFTQFYWPTVSSNCMGPGMHSTASALAIPGPQDDVAPKAKAGQTTFVFTALGTGAAAQRQGGMDVYWLNLDELRYGVTPLDNNGINKTGPATLSGVANTGKGNVIAVANGSVRTDKNNCSFAPTAALVNVR